jgi:hypothetical protein
MGPKLDSIVDGLRDSLIANGGLLPAIGTAIAVFAFAGWFAYKMKDDSPVVAVISCGIAIAAVLYVIVGYPVAVSSCKSLANSSYFGAYLTDHCSEIVHCVPPSSVLGYMPARCS